MGNQQVKGQHVWPTSCMPGIARELHSDSSTDHDPDVSESEEDESLIDPSEMENAISNNDAEEVGRLVSRGFDLNLPLTDTSDTALILAVKNRHFSIVEKLLTYSRCKKNCLNANNCSALDMALLTTFDAQNDPAYDSCWKNIECLMKANAQPVCKDAMMHVIRTALKYCNEEFLYKLFQVSVDCSNSSKLHELLLQRLHRHQPIYAFSIDSLLKSVSAFSIKLLRNCKNSDREFVVNSLIYYLDSYWDSRLNKFEVVQKLILYATAAGWKWTDQQIGHIDHVNPAFGSWCKKQSCMSQSLCHISRVSFRRSVDSNMSAVVNAVELPNSLKQYVLLKDIDELVVEGASLKDVML